MDSVYLQDVRQVLMPVTYTTGEACSSNSSTQSTHNAVPTVQVNGKKKTRPFKPGRPMTTHRKDDEELFKHLRNNPEGIGVKRKNGKYQSGTISNQDTGKSVPKMMKINIKYYKVKQIRCPLLPASKDNLKKKTNSIHRIVKVTHWTAMQRQALTWKTQLQILISCKNRASQSQLLQLSSKPDCDRLTLYEDSTVKIIPAALVKDDMQLKPGLLYDTRQGKLIGSTLNLDYHYIKQGEPDKDTLKIFTILLVAYGAGTRMVNMLKKSWFNFAMGHSYVIPGRKFSKSYILQLLYDGLNEIPPHEKPICEMNEKGCIQWLSSGEGCNQQNVKMSIPKMPQSLVAAVY
ncbi:hypothetical protein ACROYT_G036257 [Oculina patagonica]